MYRHKDPEKKQVQDKRVEQRSSRRPNPDIEQIRRELGWHMAKIAREPGTKK